MKNKKYLLKGLLATTLLALSGCKFVITNETTPNNESFLLQDDFSKFEKSYILKYSSFVIPFAHCYDYEVKEMDNYLSVEFATTEDIANAYTANLTKLITIVYDNETESYVYQANDYKIIYETTLIGKASTISFELYNLSKEEESHTHTYATTYSYNETYHWYASTCGHDVVKDKEKHTFDKGVVTKEATVASNGQKTYTCSTCNYQKVVSFEYEEEGEGFLTTTDFTSSEKKIIEDNFGQTLPFCTCYEYEVGEEEDWLGTYAYVYFETDKTNSENYFDRIDTLLTLEYDEEYKGYFYEDNNYGLEYYEEIESGVYCITVYVYSFGKGTEIVEEFIDQDDFTAADKKIISDNFEDELPFCRCYEYEVSEEEDEDGTYAYIYFATDFTNADDYYDYIDDTYDLVYDEEYECYFYEGTNYELDYYEEDEDGIYYIYIFVYAIDGTGGGSQGQDEDNKGVVLNTSTIKGLKSTYGSFSETISSIGFSFDTVSYAQNAEGYDNIIQAKKNVTNSIYNTTAFSSLNEVTIAYAKNPQSQAYKEFTVTGGSNAKSTSVSAKKSNTTSTKVDGITLSVITYTFASSVSYVNLATTGATYFNYINFGGKGGSAGGNTSIVTLEDDGNGYKTIDFTKGKVKNVTELGDYIDGCPTTGDLNVLVIPVEFPDCKASTKGYSVDTIDKAFNGDEDNTFLYYSVAKYFNMASYDQLNINFDVVDEWITTKYNSTEYEKAYNGYSSKLDEYCDYYGYSSEDEDGTYATSEMVILDECLQYLDKTLKYDLSKYDSDGNETIDAVVMIYTQDIDEENAEFFWAWRYWNMLGNPDEYYDPKDPDYGYDWYRYDGVYANDYLWASYQFLFEDEDGESFNSKSTINTYTFIHEFSHVLGADDYYDYSYESEPMDGYDMMDSKTCDHNAFTKAYLGWIENARLVTTASSITLELDSLEETGDTIILANSFDDKNGLFQEYFIIQYYEKGTGLFTKLGEIFDESGIIVYHVNATVTYDSEYEGYYLDNNNTTYTRDTTYGTDDNLIEIVKNGKGYVFGVGDTLSNVKFDDGSTLGFSFKVDKLEEGKATITFTRTATSK